MTLDLAQISDAIQSHALTSGHVERATGHEPKNAPGNGLSVAVWVQNVRPVAERAGLAATSVRVELSVRLLMPMLHEPQDEIDPTLIGAADALMRAYSGDFTLGDTVANIDLLGAHGNPLQGEAGYLNQDGKIFRAFVITLPVIVNDLWSQSG
jgi:hypothetical protein